MNLFKLYSILNENKPVSIFDEEIVDEMAMIVGDLDAAIRDVIEANPDLQGNELKRKIRGDAAVRDALGMDKLHDNQLNRFIDKVKAGGAPREINPSPSTQAPAPNSDSEAPINTSASIAPSKKMAILAKLDSGASPEELATQYGLEVDQIIAIQAASAAEDEGDVKDITGLQTGDDDGKAPRTIELDVPEQSEQNVEDQIRDKAERLFYINRKADSKDVFSRVQAWADRRNDIVDFTKAQHPLRGASDEQVAAALAKVQAELGKGTIRGAASKRLQQQKGAEAEDGATPEHDYGHAGRDKEFEREDESFMQFSKTLDEHMKTLKSTSVVRYPNQIAFSESFLDKLAEEYINHSTVTEDKSPIRNLEEKMIKALRMHIHEMARRKKESLAAEQRTPVGGVYPPERSGSMTRDPKGVEVTRKGSAYKKSHPLDRKIDAQTLKYNRSLRNEGSIAAKDPTFNNLVSKARHARKTGNKNAEAQAKKEIRNWAMSKNIDMASDPYILDALSD